MEWINALRINAPITLILLTTDDTFYGLNWYSRHEIISKKNWKNFWSTLEFLCIIKIFRGLFRYIVPLKLQHPQSSSNPRAPVCESVLTPNTTSVNKKWINIFIYSYFFGLSTNRSRLIGKYWYKKKTWARCYIFIIYTLSLSVHTNCLFSKLFNSFTVLLNIYLIILIDRLVHPLSFGSSLLTLFSNTNLFIIY